MHQPPNKTLEIWVSPSPHQGRSSMAKEIGFCGYHRFICLFTTDLPCSKSYHLKIIPTSQLAGLFFFALLSSNMYQLKPGWKFFSTMPGWIYPTPITLFCFQPFLWFLCALQYLQAHPPGWSALVNLNGPVMLWCPIRDSVSQETKVALLVG